MRPVRARRGARVAAHAPEPAQSSFYLVSAAGIPNYGDDFIARAWIRHLAAAHPDVPVWLDCPEPGRAAMLLQNDHPRLRTTNTLWQLNQLTRSLPATEVPETVRHWLDHGGTPRLDPGLLALREMRSVHVLGGGYLNNVWRENSVIPMVLAEAKRSFGLRVLATGQGLTPQHPEDVTTVVRAWAEFDHVEVRDDASGALLDMPVGLDDAFLDLDSAHRREAPGDVSPDIMVLVQGDFRSGAEDETVRRILAFIGDRREEGLQSVGFVEAMPPEDGRFYWRLREALPDARFYPFLSLWAEGVPARPGQAWLTTRFHFHLLAAAAGARGTVMLPESSGYYDVKHDSVTALGSGWTLDDPTSPSVAPPTVAADFPERARGYAERKRAAANALYPADRGAGGR